jgi:hypothetical protein
VQNFVGKLEWKRTLERPRDNIKTYLEETEFEITNWALLPNDRAQ